MDNTAGMVYNKVEVKKMLKESINITDRTTDEYLLLNSCGIRSVYETDAQVLRSKGRSDYHMLYMKNGSAEVGLGDRMERITAGQVIFYMPFERQYYFFPASERPISYWIHFCGTGVPDVFKKCGIGGSRVYEVGDKSAFESKFIELIGEYNSVDKNICAENGILMQLLASVNRSNTDSGANAVLVQRINNVVSYINQNYRENVDIDKYAKMCLVGRSRFMHIFKELTGSSVHKYQTEVRLRSACELLKYSSLNVAQTAYEVGYDDPLYFSRVFKKTYGISPKQMKSEKQ